MEGRWQGTTHVLRSILRPISIGPMFNKLFMLMSHKFLIHGCIAGIMYLLFYMKFNEEITRYELKYCSDSLEYRSEDVVFSVLPSIKRIVASNLRVWIYR